MTVILQPHSHSVKSLLTVLTAAAVFDTGQPLPVSDSLVLQNAVIDFPSH
jgi:hypothetical protein